MNKPNTIEQVFEQWWTKYREEHKSPVIDSPMMRATAHAAFMAAHDLTIDIMIDELEK